MLEDIQIIKENNVAKFVVIPFEEYQQLKELLTDPDKLADYLDYLHMQQVKAQDSTRLSLEQVKTKLSMD